MTNEELLDAALQKHGDATVVLALRTMGRKVNAPDDLAEAVTELRAAVLARMVEPRGRTYRGAPWTDEQETAAKKVYEGFKFLPGYVPWVEGGNSDKQNEARDFVRGINRSLAADAGYDIETIP